MSSPSPKPSKKPSRIIRIGIIGTGAIPQNNALSLSLVENNARKIWEWKSSPEKIKVKLYALADVDEGKVKGFATHFPAEKIYFGPQAGFQLIDDPLVDAVFVLTYTNSHLEYVLYAAEHHKHVFCEKPLAFFPAEIQQMIDARDKYSVVMQAGLAMRSASPIAYLKNLMEENRSKWGRPMNIIFRDSQDKPYTGIGRHPSTWRKDVTKSHGGILIEHSIHDIDGMISIFGEIREVYAKIRNLAGHEGIEDSVSGILTFKSGLTLSLNASWNEIDYDCRRYEIFFERAQIVIEVESATKELASISIRYLEDPPYHIPMEPMDQFFFKEIGFPHVKAELTGPYYAEDLRFINAIVHNNVLSDIPLELGKYAQTVIEACYESGRSGKPIFL